MAPINIDGSTVQDITIDGQSVTEVTVDGDVVWPSGPGAYLEDDWGDGSLQNRTGTETGTYNGVSGVYRPEWTLDATNLTPTVNASNELYIESDEGFGSTTSALYTDININLSEDNTWEWTNVDKTGINGSLQVWAESTNRGVTSAQLNDGYFLEVNSDGTLNLVKDSGGTLTDLITHTVSSWPVNSITVTRDSNGNWELFVDSTSQGTASDTEFTNPLYIAYGQEGGRSSSGTITVAEMKVY